jgi:preprotein translocase subunit YajC
MWTLFALLADAPEAPQPVDPLEALVRSPLIVIVMMFVLFWLLILRPAQRRERQQREDLMKNLKKNDEVLTTGGLIGIVAAINEKEDQVTLKLDESSNVRVRVLRSSIARILTKEPAKEAKGAEPAAKE